MAWFVLLVLVIVGGVFVYRWLVELEKEIRAEIGSEEGTTTSTDNEESVIAESEPAIVDQVLSKIGATPGLLQTLLYSELSKVDRKTLQKELLNLDRSGKIYRVRSGSTYQLFLK